MKRILSLIAVLLLLTVVFSAGGQKKVRDFSGTYCLDALNADLTIIQTGSQVTFTLEAEVLITGTGTVSGGTLTLTAPIYESNTFNSLLVFSHNRKSFAGTYQILDSTGLVIDEGELQGDKGECPTYDISLLGIPKFAERDFTQLSKIGKISKFRSGVGHDFSDGFESCRSMKHYYSVFESYRLNNTVEIYSPVAGDIVSISNDGHGASIGLNNKQVQIRPDKQPAFTIRIFHCDLASSAIAMGKKVKPGELLGYARLYYDDLAEYADSFDIAVIVHTPSGMRLISYFETLEDVVFDAYVARGAAWRQDFIITKEARDADPLQCNGQTFVDGGHLENWVNLY
jgi:hypothetical protein